MDFFAHQDAARKKTGLLVVYFVAAIVLIILTVYAAVTGIGVFVRVMVGVSETVGV